MRVEFRVLGRLEVVHEGQPVELTSPKQRVLLAVLLAADGRPVQDDRLADALWGARPPASANLRWHVHHIRQALGDGDLVARVSDGYVLAVGQEQVDAARFALLCEQGSAALASGSAAEAADTLGAALGLWRGAAYADLPDVESLREEAARLGELRLIAFEQRVEALITLGRAKDCLTELTAMVAANPMRERLREHLMRALQQAGRRADALRVYREGRELLTAELGIEPGHRLRDLHTEILRDDGSATAVRPAQLPLDAFAFTGREAELETLDELLDSGQHLPIAVVSGVGGVGKTGLAVHWAHRVAGWFPDGQLYADLGDKDPAAVLEGFLTTLGVMRVPESLEARTGLFRSLLRDRRVLLLLDNATSSAQVRPLLPGSARCCVVVTGRRRFEGLIAGEGARPIQLDVLGRQQAAELLAKVAGVEHSQAVRLAELCDGLPLALRISGARLLTRPGWTPESLADRLAEERLRLDELRAGELDVRASFEVSYRDLPWAERLLFSRLGQLEAADFAAWMAAALLDVSLREGTRLLERLAEAQLVQPLGPDAAGQERYRFHDLVRLFARSRAEDDGRTAALGRFFGCLLALAQDACLREYQGGFMVAEGDAPRWWPDSEVLPADPIAWLDAERTTLVSAVNQTASLGLPGPCWELALTGIRVFEVRGYLSDWRSTTAVALEACRAHGDDFGKAAMLASIGTLHLGEERYEEAREALERALPFLKGTFKALVLCNLGVLERAAGRLDGALSLFGEAREQSRVAGDRAAEGMTMIYMAGVYQMQGRYDMAEGVLAWAATVSEGIRRPQAMITLRLARVTHLQGRHQRAEEIYATAATMIKGIGDRVLEAQALYLRAENLVDEGQIAEARGYLAAAIELATVMAHDGRAKKARDLLAQLPGDA